MALMLAGCGSAPDGAPEPAGDQLERAAITRGLVGDPDATPLTGLFAREGDRLCIVERAGQPARIGLAIDYGEGTGCSGSGTARRRGDVLRIAMDGGECRFDTAYDGENIRVSGSVPADCARLCAGNASIAGLSVARLSSSESEARALRDSKGRGLCDDPMPSS